MEKKQIEVEIAKLKDYAFNNKVHNQKQIEELKKSIIKVWYVTDIYVDENLEILAGHWRRQALQELWYEKIKVIQVTWMTENQKKIYRLLDNKIAELAEDNEDNIKMELLEIDDIELNELYDFSMKLDDDSLDDSFELPDGDKADLVQMTFTLHKDQKAELEKAMETATNLWDFDVGMNENKNGNALARVAELFNGKDWDL